MRPGTTASCSRRSRRREATNSSTDQIRKVPNSNKSAKVLLANKWAKAQVLVPSTMGWRSRALIELPGT